MKAGMAETSQTAGGVTDRGIAVAGAAFLIEALGMASIVLLRAPIAYALLVHALVVVALAVRCRSVVRAGRDAGTPALLTVAVAVAGPFGALGGMAIDWLSVQGQEHRDRLQRWYDRISLSVDTDEVTKLSDHIVAGRGMDLGSAAPPAFIRLLEHGTVQEKQAVLGLVARRFHPRHLAALQTALVSDEPVIRVQAAAVAARVRTSLGEEVERRLEELATITAPAEMLAISDELARCAESGLLEEKQRRRAEISSREARARAIEAMTAAARPVIAGAPVAAWHPLADKTARTALEDVLLAQGRFADFRRLRRAFAYPVKGHMRFRAGRWPAGRGGAVRTAPGAVRP